MTRWSAWSLLTALLVLNLLIRFGRLDAPPHPIFDEGTFYITAARSYLDGAPDPNVEHPPLGKVAIAAGLALFGDTPWGWRSAAAAAGTSGVLLTYLFGVALWGRREAGLIAAALLTAESLWFVLSRLAMLDPFLSVGLLAALWFGWRYRTGGRWWDLALCGVCWGLAAGVKWSAALALAPLALAVIGAASARGCGERQGVQTWGRAAAALGLLGFIALAAYAVPFMGLSGLGPAALWERHLSMAAYQTAAGEQGVGLWDRVGPPLLWLLDIPVVFSAPDNRATWVLVMANPLVFWPGLTALWLLARRGV
ncbi:MAG: phospholipid carrier-dependent glycosyltransferase, partial [Chloroflexi bacterium]|nr:phospholipid carrier-dependent glycosyltransferase [Chloroflexota bacterium]